MIIIPERHNLQLLTVTFRIWISRVNSESNILKRVTFLRRSIEARPWYLNLIRAHLQIQNPKADINQTYAYHYKDSRTELEVLMRKKSSIEGQITKIQNAITSHCIWKAQVDLFYIEEKDPELLKAYLKIDAQKQKLLEIVNQIETLKTNDTTGNIRNSI